MSRFVELREELNAKRQSLHEIFVQAKDGENVDLRRVTLIEGDTATKAAEIQRRNDELTELGKEFETLREIEGIASKNREELRYLNEPVRGLPHPSPGGAPDRERQAQEAKSFGQKVVESEVITGYQKARRESPVVEIDVPDLIERKTLLTETGYAPQAVRTNLIIPGALRRPVVADLIPNGTTDQIAIVFMEETTTTNAAAAVAEGDPKPESALAFTERSSSVRKVATILPVTDELIADVPAMRSYIEARLRLFLELAEETALISGNGAPSITGFLNTANIQTQAKGADPTPDAVYKAMVLIQTVSFLDPSGVIFHPLDWQDVRLLRTADGIYIWGPPMDPGPERIWGLPVVKTTAMTQNTALVGAYDAASQIFRRMGVAFAISDQNEDFFIKNKLMLRVEERLTLVVYRPQAFCKVTGV